MRQQMKLITDSTEFCFFFSKEAKQNGQRSGEIAGKEYHERIMKTRLQERGKPVLAKKYNDLELVHTCRFKDLFN